MSTQCFSLELYQSGQTHLKSNVFNRFHTENLMSRLDALSYLVEACGVRRKSRW